MQNESNRIDDILSKNVAKEIIQQEINNLPIDVAINNIDERYIFDSVDKGISFIDTVDISDALNNVFKKIHEENV